MKLSVINFGCKLNLSESNYIKKIAQSYGFEIISDSENADIIIINACHVTSNAHQKVLSTLAKYYPKNNTKIYITGCIPANIGNKYQGITYITNKDKIPDLLSKIAKKIKIPQGVKTFRPTTREFVKIQEGCDTCCSYCIIPKYRGAPKSQPSETIIKQISQLVDQGYQEIVLTGTNLGKYSYEKNDLNSLIKKILNNTSIKRLRVSSIDATDINIKIINTFKKNTNRLCPHFHIALQSGSDNILSSMRRPYTGKEFVEKIKLIRQNIANASITTDLIVGFPGETDADFQESINIIKKCQFLKVHIFPYSEHPNTLSAKIFPKINSKTIRSRYKVAIETANTIRKKIFALQNEKTHQVLIQTKRNGYFHGFTMNYLPVKIHENNFTKNPQNTVIDIRLDKYDINGFFVEHKK